MKEKIFIGKENEISTISHGEWELQLANARANIKTRLNFMSEKHHLVRYFVVKELPRMGRPLEPAFIARELNLKLEKVNAILTELEKNLFFLVRNEEGEVSWAYPVTTTRTAHFLNFNSGERLYAA